MEVSKVSHRVDAGQGQICREREEDNVQYRGGKRMRMMISEYVAVADDGNWRKSRDGAPSRELFAEVPQYIYKWKGKGKVLESEA